MVCIICDRHRSVRGQSICHNCQAKIDAEKHAHRGETPFRYATYRGDVVGFYRNGEGKLTPRLVGRNPASLPENITINLDTYVEGMTREQVKKIKTAIAQLTA